MDYYSNQISRLIEEFSRLPGIGSKSAQRLAFHVINMPVEQVEALAQSIVDARKNVRYCKVCCTLTDREICPICSNPDRDKKTIMRYQSVPKPELPNAIPEDVQEVVKNFRSIANEASGMVRGYLKKARLSLGGDNRLLIVLPDSLAASVVGREDHVQELEDLIQQKIGKKVEVEVRYVEEGRHFEDTFVDIEQKINMEITVED